MYPLGLECAAWGIIAALAFGCGDGSKIASSGYGKASFYHKDRFVAIGSRYFPLGITAAHRTLAFGTRVKVTNMANGRSVQVIINDRGPAAWTGKDIDLSLGAARMVGMVERGVAAVKIEVLRK